MAPSLAFKFLAIAGLLSTGLTAPSPNKIIQARQSNGAAAPAATAIGPPGGSGQLRGSANLGGYTSSEQVSTPDTQVPSSEYQLAPGQALDSDTGVYLDFSDIENPQPIRGTPTNSPTDPGPREYL